MKKIKVLLFVFVMLICLMLCSCEIFHTHDYDWVNGEDYKSAYLRCNKCFIRFDPDKLYENPIDIRSDYGSYPGIPSIICYEITVEKGRFDYNEEFDILLNVYINSTYIKEGDFTVKLVESPYYEIIGDNENTTYITEQDYSTNHTFKFTVKPIALSKITRHFDFKMKFNATRRFYDEVKYYEEIYPDKDYFPWYDDLSNEYFYGTKQLMFINDSKGMFLEGEQRGVYLFHDSINRDYLAGVLDKDAYLDRVREYKYSTGAYIACFDGYTAEYPGRFKCQYLSANMEAVFYIKHSKYYKYFEEWDTNDKDRTVDLANMLVGILYENGYISLEEYQKELEYISKGEPNGRVYYGYSEMMPIEEYYRERPYDYTYIEELKASHNTSGEADGNWAAVYLSSDRIDVGTNLDLCSVY